MDVMIDLETLSTRPDCVILSIGAVLFDPHGEGVVDRLDIKPNVDEQIALGRYIEPATIDWWATQSAAARDEAFSEHDRIPFRDAIEQVRKFSWNHRAVWSNGAVFDIVIMENCFRQLAMNTPWEFWKARDTRTLYEIADVSLKDGGHVTSHKAVEDAERQAIVVQQAYRKLRLFNHRLQLA
jgi:hypothetical protein